MEQTLTVSELQKVLDNLLAVADRHAASGFAVVHLNTVRRNLEAFIADKYGTPVKQLFTRHGPSHKQNTSASEQINAVLKKAESLFSPNDMRLRGLDVRIAIRSLMIKD